MAGAPMRCFVLSYGLSIDNSRRVPRERVRPLRGGLEWERRSGGAAVRSSIEPPPGAALAPGGRKHLETFKAAEGRNGNGHA
jgi:hypothetical protein